MCAGPLPAQPAPMRPGRHRKQDLCNGAARIQRSCPPSCHLPGEVQFGGDRGGDACIVKEFAQHVVRFSAARGPPLFEDVGDPPEVFQGGLGEHYARLGGGGAVVRAHRVMGQPPYEIPAGGLSPEGTALNLCDFCSVWVDLIWCLCWCKSLPQCLVFIVMRRFGHRLGFATCSSRLLTP